MIATKRLAREACAVIVGALVLAPIVFPFLYDKFPHTHDGGHHVAYVVRFDRTLHQGQLPVRWTEPILPGRGQPLFNYYQVGFFYIVSAVHEFSPGLLPATKAGIVLLWWSGAAFMFLLCRRFGPFPALTASVVFALSPYLIVDVFVRGAFPEFAAITCSIAALWMLDRFLISGSSLRLVMFAVGLAATALSHPAVALVLTPVFAVYVVWLRTSGNASLSRIAGALAGGAVAIGLSAFYVGPLFLERDLVKLPRLTQEALDYHRHFVPAAQLVRYTTNFDWTFGNSVSEPNNLMPLHISLLECLLIGVGALILFAGIYRRTLSVLHIGLAVWLSVIAMALFMMARASLPVWEHLPALAFVQFPWKFLMLVPVACSLLAALIVSAVRRTRMQALMTVGIIGLQAYLHYGHLRPDTWGEPRLYDVDRPGWHTDPAAQSWDFFERALSPIRAPDDPAVLTRWSLTEGDGLVTEMMMFEHRKVLRVMTENGARISLHTPYFPGWTVRLDNAVVRPRVRPEDGYMEIDVPRGSHSVVATFEDTPIRSWSNRISVLSLVVILAAGLRRRVIG